MARLCRIALASALFAALPALAQSGLRLPERGEQGLDPSFARGWLAPEYDRFGFATYQWRDPYSFALEPRPLSVFGRYWLSPDWALRAESASRDPTGLFRLQDFRIGVQRRF